MGSILIDVGNSNIHIGLTSKEKLFLVRHYSRNIFLASLHKLIKKYRPQQAYLCSVVPTLGLKVRALFKKYKLEIYETGKEIKIPVKNLYKKPKEVGQDRLLGVYAAKNVYKNVGLVVDLGTALTFDFISLKGAYVGGLIFPGMDIALEALLKRCALLPKRVSLKPKPILKAKSTSECISSGVVLGYNFLIGGLVGYIRKQKKNRFKVLLTGGGSKLIIKPIAGVDYIQPNLTLLGLNLLQKNIKK